MRQEQIAALENFGLINEGLSLAEKYRDMDILVALLSAKSAIVMKTKDLHALDSQTSEWENKTRHYFDTFGEAFGKAFFDAQVSHGMFAELLDLSPDYGKELTLYLRGSKPMRKISWMNDILSESDFLRASDELAVVSNFEETDNWSRRVELSLASLSLMAAEE